jgi:hypothetical protein
MHGRGGEMVGDHLYLSRAAQGNLKSLALARTALDREMHTITIIGKLGMKIAQSKGVMEKIEREFRRTFFDPATPIAIKDIDR